MGGFKDINVGSLISTGTRLAEDAGIDVDSVAREIDIDSVTRAVGSTASDVIDTDSLTGTIVSNIVKELGADGIATCLNKDTTNSQECINYLRTLMTPIKQILIEDALKNRPGQKIKCMKDEGENEGNLYGDCTINDIINLTVTNIINGIRESDSGSDSGSSSGSDPSKKLNRSSLPCIDKSNCTMVDLVNTIINEQVYLNQKCEDNGKYTECSDTNKTKVETKCYNQNNCTINDLINTVISQQLVDNNTTVMENPTIKNYINLLLTKTIDSLYETASGKDIFYKDTNNQILTKQYDESQGDESQGENETKLESNYENLLIVLTYRLNESLQYLKISDIPNISPNTWNLINNIITLFLNDSFLSFIKELSNSNVMNEILRNPDDLGDKLSNSFSTLMQGIINSLRTPTKCMDSSIKNCTIIENFLYVIFEKIKLSKTDISNKHGMDKFKYEVDLLINDIINNYLLTCPKGCHLINTLDDTGNIKTSCVTDGNPGIDCNFNPEMGKLPTLIKSLIKETINGEFTNCGPPDTNNKNEICMGFDDNNNSENCYNSDNCSSVGSNCRKIAAEELKCSDIINQGLCSKAGCTINYTGDSMQAITKSVINLEGIFLNNKVYRTIIILLIVFMGIIAMYSFIKILEIII